jgi:hypothetical protein
VVRGGANTAGIPNLGPGLTSVMGRVGGEFSNMAPTSLVLAAGVGARRCGRLTGECWGGLHNELGSGRTREWLGGQL